MNDLIDFLTSNTTLAYITAVIIFIITVVLLVKRLIGFMVSLLLLAFALLSGLAIANHDLFREVLQNFKYDSSKTPEDKSTHFKNQLLKAYEELKEEFYEQKEKIETMYEAYQHTNGKTSNEPAKTNGNPPTSPKSP